MKDLVDLSVSRLTRRRPCLRYRGERGEAEAWGQNGQFIKTFLAGHETKRFHPRWRSLVHFAPLCPTFLYTFIHVCICMHICTCPSEKRCLTRDITGGNVAKDIYIGPSQALYSILASNDPFMCQRSARSSHFRPDT